MIDASRFNGKQKDKEMAFRAGAHRSISGFISRAVKFCSDRRGVAAVEFAFIAPILMIMYFITMEAAQGIETSKKVSRIGSMVADLVAQQDQVQKSDLDAIMQIAESTLQPYNRSEPTVRITAIQISNDSVAKPTVLWSRKVTKGVYTADAAKGSTATVPTTLKIAGTFLIRVESALKYKPIITWAAGGQKTLGLTDAFDNISMSETYYLRPRVIQTINCSDC